MRAASRALVGLSLVLAGCSGRAPTVDRLTIRNTTAYDLDVEVTDRTREGWLPLGIAQTGSEGTWREVIDQGDVWVVRFLHWGDPVGEIELTRTELEDSGWRLEVPDDVGERIEELGRMSRTNSTE